MLQGLVIALLVAFVIVNLAYVVVNDRRDRRYSDELDRLRDERQMAVEQHRREVADLLQRIQAPQAAIIEHAQRNTDPDPNPYPLSETEQAAGQGVTQAMIAQIERMEREGFDMHMPQG